MYYVVASDHRRIHIDHHHNLLRDFRPLDAMPHPKLHSDSNHYFYNIALFWILDQWFYLKWIGCWSDIPHTHLLVITSWSQISSSKSRPTQSISFLCMTSQNIIWMTNGIWRNGWMFANVKEIHIAIYSLSCKKHGILWHITRSIMNRTQNVNLFISPSWLIRTISVTFPASPVYPAFTICHIIHKWVQFPSLSYRLISITLSGRGSWTDTCMI